MHPTRRLVLSVATILATLASLLALTITTNAAGAAAFGSGNVVLLRLGDGTSALSSAAAPAFLDEYAPNGTLVQTVPLPTAPSGGGAAFTNSGSATSEGALTLSPDGAHLALGGYDAAPGTTGVASSTAAAVNRVVALVDGSGSVDTSTRLTNAYSGNNIRGAVTTDGTAIWTGGNGNSTDGGVRYAAKGATSSTTVSNSTANVRVPSVAGGQLYASSGSGAFIGVNAVGTGTPTTSGNALANIANIPNGAYGYTFLDREVAVPGPDTLYTASDNGQGIKKFSFDGTSWTARGTFTAPGATNFTGVTASVSGANALLFATVQGSSNNSFASITDVAASAATIDAPSGLTVLATAGTNRVFRGLALAPAASAEGPSISAHPQPQTIVSGATATLSVTATGTAPLTYQWYEGTSGDTSDPVPGETGSSFTTPALTATTSYWVRVTNAFGSVDSETATVTVQTGGGTPPTITQPDPLANAAGDPTNPTGAVTVGDAETDPGSLVVTATATTNATVAPLGAITVSGAGADRSVAVAPAGVGYADITLTVTDGSLTATTVLRYAASAASATPSTTRYPAGAADSSTAVDVGGGHALVADDENQALRLYDTTRSGLPVASFDYTTSLGLTDTSGGVPREVDIEASARSGDRIYWLASLGNSSSGSNRPNRNRLFATDVSGSGALTTLSFVGYYDQLKQDLLAWDQGNGDPLGLTASAAVGVAPEAPGGVGFNIEGLEFAPGSTTTAYLAFRAPLQDTTVRTDALIIPVTNLPSLVTASPASGPATFGSAFDLDLGGLGVRELRKNGSSQYLVVAGPATGSGSQALYTWDGAVGHAPVRRGVDLASAGAEGAYEAIASLPDPLTSASTLRLIADSGDTIWYGDGVIAKDLPTPQFRKARTDAFTLGGVVTRIRDVQGTGHVSPFAASPDPTVNGESVSNVPGVVTAVRSNGFWLQDPSPDADDATSEGIFVFTSSSPPVAAAVGNSVLVSGVVTEFRNGCNGCAPSSSAFNNLTTTEIKTNVAGGSVGLVASGVPLPAVTVIGSAGRMPPAATIDDDTTGSVETGPTTFDPSNDGIDFYESLEGTRVAVQDPVATGPTSYFSAATIGHCDAVGGNCEIPVVPDGGAGAGPRTIGGGVRVTPGDFNPERIILNNVINPAVPTPMPDVNVGATFDGDVVGIVDYAFANYKLLPTQALPSLSSPGRTRETLSLGSKADDEIDVGNLNVENLAFGDPQTKFDQIASQAVDAMGGPDILLLQEIQDDSGATNNGVVSSTQTQGRLLDAIVAAGGATYAARSINPVDGADGGAPGGNIRQVIFYRTDTGLSFVDRGGAGPTTPNAVNDVGGQPQLAFSPGRIDPANTAWNSSRKPLAAEFSYNGKSLFVVANHFNSKGGDQPLFGRFQPPELVSEAQRVQQAQAVAGFAAQITAIDPQARVIVAGDLNDFEFSPPLAALTGAGLVDLVTALPATERYTYVFQGNSQVLDHILVSPVLATGAGYDVVHVNAEFHDQASDHDPEVARLAVAGDPYAATIESTGGVESVGTLGFEISLDRPVAAGDAIQVVFAAQSRSAVVNRDFGGKLVAVPFGPGEQTKTVGVTVINDTTAEPGEYFVGDLISVSSDVVTPGPDAVGLIADDDPDPSAAISDASTTEGDSGTKNLVFTVTLAQASGKTVTMRFATANGTAVAPSDYRAASGLLTFAPGQVTKTVTIKVVGDTTAEPQETFFLNLSQPTNVSIADGSGTGGILNDD